MGLFGDAGLTRALAAYGVNRDAVDAVCLTHLHADHVGWLALADGAPIFPNADILVPRADFDHYVGGDLPQLPRSARDLLRALAGQAWPGPRSTSYRCSTRRAGTSYWWRQ